MEKKSTPTIYDVAKEAGVSISTVSRVLNAPQRVKETTRKKVLTAIEQLNFIPKAEASARAMKQLGRIGVLTPSMTFPSFVERLRGVVNALDGTDYELIVYSVGNATQLQHYLDMLAVSKRIDGLIIITLAVDAESLTRIMANGIEVVSVEVANPGCCSITVDNILGGQLAAEHFLKKGYRRYAYLGETKSKVAETNKNRLHGFRKTLADAGIPLSESYIRIFPFDMDDVIEQTHQLLDLSPRPEAIFAYSDLYAIGVLKAARQRNMRIPDELAVIGFDSIDAADFMEITTIDQNLEESGRLAVEVLLSRIAGNTQSLQHIELGIHVHVRRTA
jgi:LacI family transcriptional regulator